LRSHSPLLAQRLHSSLVSIQEPEVEFGVGGLVAFMVGALVGKVEVCIGLTVVVMFEEGVLV
jgi:hypothetical protein